MPDTSLSWSEEETENLRKQIKKFTLPASAGNKKTIRWAQVSYVVGRSVHSCKSRHRLLLERDADKFMPKAWTPEEEQKLLDSVKKYTARNSSSSFKKDTIPWGRISTIVDRSVDGCKKKYDLLRKAGRVEKKEVKE